jgi:glycosyltransferase involved in cell wall biosynthesis
MRNTKKSSNPKVKLSVALCIKNEGKRLKKCLDNLIFADEIVILLDGCSDNSKKIAKKYTNKIC